MQVFGREGHALIFSQSCPPLVQLTLSVN